MTSAAGLVAMLLAAAYLPDLARVAWHRLNRSTSRCPAPGHLPTPAPPRTTDWRQT